MSQALLHSCPRCSYAFEANTVSCRNCGYTLSNLNNGLLQAGTQEFSPSQQLNPSLAKRTPETEVEPLTENRTDLYDTRYPRPFWFRLRRRLIIILVKPIEVLVDWITLDEGWKICLLLALIAYLAGAIIYGGTSCQDDVQPK